MPSDESKSSRNDFAGHNQQLARNVEHIIALFENMEQNFAETAEELQKHGEVSGELLRRVNSAGYGLQHDIARIEHALAILGSKKAVELVSDILQNEGPEAKTPSTKPPV